MKVLNPPDKDSAFLVVALAYLRVLALALRRKYPEEMVENQIICGALNLVHELTEDDAIRHAVDDTVSRLPYLVIKGGA